MQAQVQAVVLVRVLVLLWYLSHVLQWLVPWLWQHCCCSPWGPGCSAQAEVSNIPLLAFPWRACSWASYGLLVVAYDPGAREVVECPPLTRGTLLGPWAPSSREQPWQHLDPQPQRYPQ